MKKEIFGKKSKGLLLSLLIAGMLIAAYVVFVPTEIKNVIEGGDEIPTVEERSWKSIFRGSLGDLDEAYGSGNTSIIGVWIVNHTDEGQSAYGNYSEYATAGSGGGGGACHSTQNDSATFNSSVTVHGYAQASGFRLDVPHSTAVDVIIRIRANATNAATGTTATDQFNATWVSCNLTSADFSIPGGVNMTRYVTHNESGTEFIYINFVYNGTFQTGWDDSTTTTGAGIQIPRGNESYFGWINLSAYY